jgi:hypothetical protein
MTITATAVNHDLNVVRLWVVVVLVDDDLASGPSGTEVLSTVAARCRKSRASGVEVISAIAAGCRRTGIPGAKVISTVATRCRGRVTPRRAYQPPAYDRWHPIICFVFTDVVRDDRHRRRRRRTRAAAVRDVVKLQDSTVVQHGARSLTVRVRDVDNLVDDLPALHKRSGAPRIRTWRRRGAGVSVSSTGR